MNRKISYNWLKEYIKSSVSVDEFSKRLSLKSMSVERIEETKPLFQGVITAKILEIIKHPNADKLQLATVDTGKTRQTVVCGAPNIKVGQIVLLAVAGAKLPDPTKKGEIFILQKANIRGVESSGMLCASDELGLGDDHAGILILPPETKIGCPLEEVINFNDHILDIEITSNRPDAMSVVGLAREAFAAIKGSKFIYPDLQPKIQMSRSAKKMPLAIKIEETKLCPRYQGVVMTDIKIGPSPLWMQLRLMRSGLRPINNLVDITNYILLEYGKPMHVFDYDKIQGGKIIVRKARAGENILALDGNTYDLKSNHLVIADEKRPVAIAGIMGGELSAATEQTTTIIFESAVFNSLAIRKIARELNLHSDSSDLFEKGLPAESVSPAIIRAIELTQQLAGGKVVSEIVDVGQVKYKPVKISLYPQNVQRYLGVTIKPVEIKNILKSLGFDVAGSSVLKVTVPWWRSGDVEFDYDLIEEIARIYGYHNLPTELPTGVIPLNQKDPVLFWEDRAKNVLAGIGFSEVYNYSMVSRSLLNKIGFDQLALLKINNPLNEDLEYMRPTLFAQILQNISDNLNNFSEQKIFELSNVYLLNNPKDLPVELPKLTGAIVGKDEFLQIKGAVELLLKKLGIGEYEVKSTDQKCPLWQLGQALDIYQDNKFLGQFGLVNQDILAKFDIQKPVALFDFDFSILSPISSTVKNFQSIPEFPEVERDLALIVDNKITWQQINDIARTIDKLVVEVRYLNTFIDSTLGDGKKSVAFRLVFRSVEKTLKSQEVDDIIKKLVDILTKEFNAKLR